MDRHDFGVGDVLGKAGANVRNLCNRRPRSRAPRAVPKPEPEVPLASFELSDVIGAGGGMGWGRSFACNAIHGRSGNVVSVAAGRVGLRRKVCPQHHNRVGTAACVSLPAGGHTRRTRGPLRRGAWQAGVTNRHEAVHLQVIRVSRCCACPTVHLMSVVHGTDRGLSHASIVACASAAL